MYSFYQVNPSQEAYCKLTQVHCPLTFCVWVFQLAIFDNYMYMYWNIMTRDCIQINMGITKSSSFHMQQKLSVYPQAHISFSLWSVCFFFFLEGGGIKRRGWFRRGGLNRQDEMKEADTQTNGFIQALCLLLWLTRCEDPALHTCIIYDLYLRPIVLLGLLYTCAYLLLALCGFLDVGCHRISVMSGLSVKMRWYWRLLERTFINSLPLCIHWRQSWATKHKNKAVYLWHSNLHQSASGSTQSAPWKPK